MGLHVESDEPLVTITSRGPTEKVTVAAWSYLDRFIVTGHEDGSVSSYEVDTGDEVRFRHVLLYVTPVLIPDSAQYDSNQIHQGLITDLQMSPDRTWFVTSSKDKTAKARTHDIEMTRWLGRT